MGKLVAVCPSNGVLPLSGVDKEGQWSAEAEVSS